VLGPSPWPWPSVADASWPPDDSPRSDDDAND
jgi:hypothetical protein